ncbi:MAG: TonB-dependent receptor, partial [Bacteroidetes bacterium HGW-Bacteroidetes-22]
MKKPVVIILLFFFVSLGMKGQEMRQTIKGSVVDIDTRQPLPGVNIIVLQSDPLIGATSDADGKFRLPAVPPGRYSLQISFIGYQSRLLSDIDVSSGKEVVLNLEMKEKVMEAKEVVITARAEKEKPINSMTAISARSFSVEETRRYAGSADDPLRAASSFAGVAASASSERNDIVVRGNNPKGLLWRLDGVDIPNPNHFARIGNSGGGLTLFSSQVLSNSDFLTSAFPAEYGEALAGVFDIRFRNGNSDRHEYTLQLGTLGIDVAAEGP